MTPEERADAAILACLDADVRGVRLGALGRAVSEATAAAVAAERERCAQLCADRARQLRQAAAVAATEGACAFLISEARTLEDMAEGIRGV